MPDNVTLVSTRKTFQLNLNDEDVQYYPHGDVYKRVWGCVPKGMDEDDVDCELFVTTGNMALNWLNNMPCKPINYDDYGSVTVTFDMDDVESEGFTEVKLIGILNEIVRTLNYNMNVFAWDAPYVKEETDMYGRPIEITHRPALKPLHYTPQVDYPSEINVY